MQIFPPCFAPTCSARIEVLVPPPHVLEHSCNIDQLDHWQSTGGFVVVVVVVVFVAPSTHSTSMVAFSPALQLAQP